MPYEQAFDTVTDPIKRASMGKVAMVGSDRKLGELLLYLADQLADQRSAGATKLNKLAYFAELAHLRSHGTAITGAEYQRLPNGPAPRRLVPVRDALVSSGDAEVVSQPVLGRLQHRLVALRTPNLDVFSESERAAIDEVVDMYGGSTGRDLTEESHLDQGWRLVADRETIPLEVGAFLAPPHTSPAIATRARELVEHYGTDTSS